MTDEMNVGWPEGSWQPHKRETWPFQFATVKEPTKLWDWDGSRDPFGTPIFIERWIPAGTRVRIVMVSRLGDVGITDVLTDERNYKTRVMLRALDICRE